MYSFLNLNNNIRDIIEKLYKDLLDDYNTDNTIDRITKIMADIKEENYQLYRLILGVSFIDRYLLLKVNEKTLTELEKNILEYMHSINNLDELEVILCENNLLNYLLTASLRVKRLNKKNKAQALLHLDDIDVFEFNKFSLIEKMDMFRDRDIHEIIFFYKNIEQEHSEKAILEIIQLFDILLLGNMKNYSNLIIQIIQVLYKLYKVNQLTSKQSLLKQEKIIIELVENYNLDQVVFSLTFNKYLLEDLIRDYLHYETTEKKLDKKKIDLVYESCVDAKVKTKLKEVYLF